jgi:hypothetical protein
MVVAICGCRSLRDIAINLLDCLEWGQEATPASIFSMGLVEVLLF